MTLYRALCEHSDIKKTIGDSVYQVVHKMAKEAEELKKSEDEKQQKQQAAAQLQEEQNLAFKCYII